MDNKNKISNISILLTIAGMLALNGPISYSFSNDVFAQTGSPINNNTGGDADVKPNIKF